MWKELPKDLTLLSSKRERLENLYYLIDKNGRKVQFKLNWAQQELNDNRWYQMIILKARQLGCTTFWAIDFLDDCFWMPNLSAGIIAHRREDAESIFKNKVKFAYENMPQWTRLINSATNDRAGELAFKNGSIYRVSTGFRSGTNQRLLVSEFGKICAKTPDIAKEIVTGSLNTVAKDQILVIESTAEGREGYFYDFTKEAEILSLEKKKLSPMQKRFFFFPWFKEPSYREYNPFITVSQSTNDYINLVEMETGFKIDADQRRWYQLKSIEMGDSMKQEYPSTPKEAFEASNEGLYYGAQIAMMRREGKICKLPYQESSQVHTAFDIGYHDFTSVWFFQLAPGGVIQVIDCYQNCNEGAKFYIDVLKSKRYTYGTHIFPHDARNHNPGTGTSWEEEFTKLTRDRVWVLEQKECAPLNGIQTVRSFLSRCYFDEDKCKAGLQALESYKKEWNDKIGSYRSTPLHDKSSHFSDSFRYLCTAVDLGYVGGGYMTPEKLNQLKASQGFGPKSQPRLGQQKPFTGGPFNQSFGR